MIPNVTHHHHNLTELHCKQINITSCDLFWTLLYKQWDSMYNRHNYIHEFHGAEKMKPKCLSLDPILCKLN